MINNVVYLNTFGSDKERFCEVTEGLSKYNKVNAEVAYRELQKGYMKLLAEFKNN